LFRLDQHQFPAIAKPRPLCATFCETVSNNNLTMKKLLFLIILFPLFSQGHPGVGIVKDSKGNIYYTDAKQVWKITKGNKTVVVTNVHTHELYVDQNDNVYGEDVHYNDKANKFYHYLWVYRPNGQIDTVIGMKEAYIFQDFSLARDKKGNQYYIKRFLVRNKDTNHIYKLSPEGKETIFATGNFKDISWLHPQDDGSLFYVSNNAIYKVDTLGNIRLVKEHVGNIKPSFKFSGNSITIWGVWQDNAKNIYAAVFSDQTVKKIDVAGNMTDIYKSKGNWTPLHGVFDNDNKLWVLESSDKNDVRVTLADTTPITTQKTNSNLMIYIIVSCIVVGIVMLYLKFKYFNSIKLSRLKS